jgi:hypothetical protein
MLRGNLSTRPLYNERAVQALLVGLTALLALVSLFTVWQFIALTGQQRELWASIGRDEARAASLRLEAQQVRSRVDPRLFATTVNATREANAVIDERTFSWTALFNVFERTIPSEVRLRAVTPGDVRGVLLVRFTVNTPRVEPVGQFLDRLEAAGAFAQLRSVEEQTLDDGTYNVVCEGQYLGPGSERAAATPAPEPSAETGSTRTRAGGN